MWAKKSLFFKKNAKKFAYVRKKQYLCSRFRSKSDVGGIAQLVRAHDS